MSLGTLGGTSVARAISNKGVVVGLSEVEEGGVVKAFVARPWHKRVEPIFWIS